MKNNIFFVSLGCDKNRVDSEEMLALLDAAGFSFVDDEYEADIIVVNTCAFIDAAKEESIETILEMARLKTEGRLKRLVVAGCLAQRYKDEIRKELPEVDEWIGTNDLREIVPAVSGNKIERSSCIDYKTEGRTLPAKRIITTGGHYEFLKIAEGCNKRCSYCIIPYIRGNYRSYDMDNLISEAYYLAGNGVKELIVVAQETSVYGRDLYGKDMLPELLRRLCRIDGFEWIRVLYCYPEDITEEFLEVMASEPKICKYIDMPIQHASDRILKMMGRHTSLESIKKTINLARKTVSQVVLRTSLITGFPSEGDADFEIMKDFVRESAFEHLGVFTYSREEGTRAALFDGQIDEKIKVARRDELMEIQKKISYNNLQSKAGMVYNVFVEGKLIDEDVYVGRTYMDAPDVDSFFYFKFPGELSSGSFVKAKVLSANEYDLYGECINEFT